MSEFNKLHEHLLECVDSENDSFIGITEDGVEFNVYEYAFGLSVCAKREHDRLVEENKRLRGLLAKINDGDEKYIENGQMFTEIKQLLSELGGE